nr:uncharacterized protein LOC109166487 [Ipomoea trifida]
MRASLRRTVAPISERWLGNTEDSKTMGTPLQTPNFDSATTMHGDLSKEPSSSANARWVSSLLLPDYERWNVELIRDLFDPMDVNRIMKTPVNREMEDGWYWRHELRGGYPLRSGYRWLEPVLTKANGETQKKIAVIIWFIWCERNALVWNNKSFNANNVLCQALNWLTDWYDLIKRKVMTNVRTESPQPTAALRCFVDVLLFENVDLGGFGVIAINNEDFIVAACSGTHYSSLDPYHVELWAIKEALSWIKKENWCSQKKKKGKLEWGGGLFRLLECMQRPKQAL